mgnify:CR=1 FL=1
MQEKFGLHKNKEDAIKKAEKEFQIYRERVMKEFQSDFDMLMKSLPNKKENE